MRLIKRTTLVAYAHRFPKAATPLDDWARLTLSAAWKNLVDTRKTFPHADQVKVKSGRTVTVFNLCGNDFRLITAIHYDRRKVFALNFLTHAEYCKDTWKSRL
ncbi:MAG: type II toxin-antitoxin system HigB family toxin [Chthoniobacterales bacterium]|nr:type II toxin-antitoxin system HigB family toxin [Chthoniobacterales bacterium]